MSSSIFSGKTLLITGGTGSFGNAVLNRFLKTDIGEIRIFSRDEKKAMAKGLRDDGVSLDIISKRTGFTIDELKAL